METHDQDDALLSLQDGRQELTQITGAASLEHGLSVGLKILEYLEKNQFSVTLSAVAQELNLPTAVARSSVAVLERHGYLIKADEIGLYERASETSLLKRAPLRVQRLLTHAGPAMKALCADVMQSSNLTIQASREMLVIGHEESPGPFGIRLPAGYRYDIPSTAPGIAFLASIESGEPHSWLEWTTVGARQQSQLKTDTQKAAHAGYAAMQDPQFPDVLDLSCPVFEKNQFVAALTIPFLETRNGVSVAWCVAAMQRAAEEISMSLLTDARRLTAGRTQPLPV